MRWSQLLVPFLAAGISGACLAQSDRPAIDPTQRAVTEARNAGRFTDAEQLLTDAIHDLEQSDPQNPRLAQYLKELAPLVTRRNGMAAGAPFVERAYEIDRTAFGPTDLRVANDISLLASYAQAASNTQDADQRFNEALGIVRLNAAKLRWNAGAGVAAGVVGAAVLFYIAEKRWVSAEILMPEETKLCDMLPDEFRGRFWALRAPAGNALRRFIAGKAGRARSKSGHPARAFRPSSLP